VDQGGGRFERWAIGHAGLPGARGGTQASAHDFSPPRRLRQPLDGSGPANLIGSPPDTGFADVGAAGSFYEISALDIHGNEGGFALLTPSGTTDVGGGTARELALARPAPNPARGAARIGFTLSREGAVNLAIYDIAGRKERVLVEGVLPAGEHAQSWDLRDASGATAHAGLYFVRLEAEGRHLTQRLVVTGD